MATTPPTRPPPTCEVHKQTSINCAYYVLFCFPDVCVPCSAQILGRTAISGEINTWAHRYQRAKLRQHPPAFTVNFTHTISSHSSHHHLELPVELPVIVPWLQPAHMLMPLIPNCIRSLHILQFVSFPRECILA